MSLTCSPTFTGDFEAWLRAHQEELKIGDENLAWYANQLALAKQFGWQCRGEAMPPNHPKPEEQSFRFTWYKGDCTGPSASGTWDANIYAAFLSSIEARRRLVWNGPDRR